MLRQFVNGKLNEHFSDFMRYGIVIFVICDILNLIIVYLLFATGKAKCYSFNKLIFSQLLFLCGKAAI